MRGGTTDEQMGEDYGRFAAGHLADELHERLIAVWHNLEAQGEVPKSAEGFGERRCAHGVRRAVRGAEHSAWPS
jgi:hypothetical protein